MRSLPICLKSPAQKVSDWVDGELGSLPLHPVCDDFELLLVEQKNTSDRTQSTILVAKSRNPLLAFFKNKFFYVV